MKKTLLTLAFLSLIFILGRAQESSTTITQEPRKHNVFVSMKDTSGVILFFDGNKASSKVIEILDVDKITAIDILNGNEAIKIYNAPSIIFITTKNMDNIKIERSEKDSDLITVRTIKNDNDIFNPIVIIDEKPASTEKLKALSPNSILKIEIRKDEKMLKKYNTDTGVIFVTTKGDLGFKEGNISLADSKMKIRLKDDSDDPKNPLIIIDGKKYDSDIFNLLDIDRIDSILVIKGEEAIKKYNAPDVVVITTKSDMVIKNIKFSINENDKPKESNAEDSKTKKKLTINSFNFEGLSGSNVPVFVIDGEIKNGEQINDIMPIDISSIKILKDEKSKIKYNTEVGVILITTIKKK